MNEQNYVKLNKRAMHVNNEHQVIYLHDLSRKNIRMYGNLWIKIGQVHMVVQHHLHIPNAFSFYIQLIIHC